MKTADEVKTAVWQATGHHPYIPHGVEADRESLNARRMAAWLMREALDLHFREISKALNMSGTAALNAVSLMETERNADPEIRRVSDELLKMYKPETEDKV